MTDTLRAKAEAVPSRKWHHHADDVQMFYGGRDSQGITEFTDACSPATVLGLLDRLAAAEALVAKWRGEVEMVERDAALNNADHLIEATSKDSCANKLEAALEGNDG